ncbi:MAG: RHS repeat-associated core domain-containing protein [Bacteroidales bacterium]
MLCKKTDNFVPFLYQGQYFDEETGLAYNRFRYYNPAEGAYISQDPIGLAGGMPNLYAYVGDSNYWIDPWGLTGMFI